MVDSIIGILKAVSLTPTDGVMILVCTGLLFVLYKLLEAKVFMPLLEHVEQREAVTTGAVFTASQMRQKTAALKARFDEAIFKARVAGNTKRAQVLSGAKERASKMVGKAEDDAAAELAAGRREIAKQIANARKAAEVEAHDLARSLAQQVDTHLSQGV